MKYLIILLMMIGCGSSAAAQDHTLTLGVESSETVQRTAFNYAINCRGCHGPEAMATHASVPDMKDFIDRFLEVEGGREYLIQVPGVSRSALSDQEVADMLNWLIVTQGRKKTIQRPFKEAEIRKHRSSPLSANAATVRASLIEKIKKL